MIFYIGNRCKIMTWQKIDAGDDKDAIYSTIKSGNSSNKI